MLRISHYLRSLTEDAPTPRRAGGRRAPVVIWNLPRRCNPTCKHCYSTSADSDFRGELETAEILRGIDDLRAAGVRVLILSGGEPLMHRTSSRSPPMRARPGCSWRCRATVR